MQKVYDLDDKLDQLIIIIILMVVFCVGFCVGILLYKTDIDMLEKDFNKLEHDVFNYAEREFSIILQGRKIEIWDSLGMIDSVSIVGDGDGQDHKY